MNLRKPYLSILLIAVLLSSLMINSAFAKTGYNSFSFNKQTIIKDTLPAKDSIHGDEAVFENVEEEAYFPGGETEWRHYLEQNLNANTPVDYGAPAGSYTVWIQFVVDTAGRLSNFKPLTRHNFGMEAEVLRILRKSPPWISAVQKGRKVKAYRKQPVTFVVIEEKKKRRNRD